MAHVVNISSREFNLEIGTSAGRKPKIHKLRPGDVAEVDDAYAAKRYPAEGRDPIPSIIEQISNRHVVPADDPRAADLYAAWCDRMNAPAPMPPPEPAPRAAAPAQKGR